MCVRVFVCLCVRACVLKNVNWGAGKGTQVGQLNWVIYIHKLNWVIYIHKLNWVINVHSTQTTGRCL
jgi:hypothetical protein